MQQVTPLRLYRRIKSVCVGNSVEYRQSDHGADVDGAVQVRQEALENPAGLHKMLRYCYSKLLDAAKAGEDGASGKRIARETLLYYDVERRAFRQVQEIVADVEAEKLKELMG